MVSGDRHVSKRYNKVEAGDPHKFGTLVKGLSLAAKNVRRSALVLLASMKWWTHWYIDMFQCSR